MLFQDISSKLVLHVTWFSSPAREAVVVDDLVLDLVGGFRELAGRAEHELLDVD